MCRRLRVATLMPNSCTSLLFKAPCTMGVLVHSFWSRMQDCARALKTQVGLWVNLVLKLYKDYSGIQVFIIPMPNSNQLLFDISGLRI